MKKIFVFVMILIVILFIKSGFSAPSSTQKQIQTNKIPAQYQNDKNAYVNSVVAIGKAKTLTQPKNGIMSPVEEDKEREASSLIGNASSLSNNVRDEFLDYLNPELKNMYRNKLIKGAELLEEGKRTNNLQKQLEGAKLDEEWRNWFNEHGEDIANKVF